MTVFRIGIGGMSIESSTFSAHTSGFESFTITHGAELMQRIPSLMPGQPQALRMADMVTDSQNPVTVEFVPLVHARSLPGGKVDPEVFTFVCDELAARIANAGRLDALVLDIHGAMNVIGLDDAEAILTKRVREALDAKPIKELYSTDPYNRIPIAATLDLHGNVTAELVEHLDMITCYRLAPHEDWAQTRERCVDNLVDHLVNQKPMPYMAYVGIPVLLPGEKTSTRVEPAKTLYENVTAIADQPGVVDASLWVGYAWADERRSQASVVVMADSKPQAVQHATHIAKQYWGARNAFEFVAPTDQLDVVLSEALNQTTPGPHIISDSGDNPTAGGTGDVTWTLTQLLQDPRCIAQDAKTIYVASLFDKEAVAVCFAAGLFKPVRLHAGARIDSGSAGPVKIDGTVVRLTHGDEVSGRIAVVQVGGVHAIITERRKPYHRRSDFAKAGLDIFDADIIIVKIGYLVQQLYDAAVTWKMALTPGGVDQDLIRLGHNRIMRPMFPFDTDFTPKLEATVYRYGQVITD